MLDEEFLREMIKYETARLTPAYNSIKLRDYVHHNPFEEEAERNEEAKEELMRAKKSLK